MTIAIKEQDRIQVIFDDIGLTGPAAEATRKYLEKLQEDCPLSDKDLELAAGFVYDGFQMGKGIDPFITPRC